MTKTKMLRLSADDSAQLGLWMKAVQVPTKVAQRCRIVLASSQGESDLAIAQREKINRHTVRLWRMRVEMEGIAAIWEIQPGRGRKPKLENIKVRDEIYKQLATWSVMGKTSHLSLAKQLGVDKKTVARICDHYNLNTVSQHSKGEPSGNSPPDIGGIVGLYLNPPQKACVVRLGQGDEGLLSLLLAKNSASHCTRLRDVHAPIMQIFSALNDRVGVGHPHAFERNKEWLRFLRKIDSFWPGDYPLHIFKIRSGVSKAPGVVQWLQHHSRFHCHILPTENAWCAAMHCLFNWLQHKPNSLAGVLQCAMQRAMDTTDGRRGPFVWIANQPSRKMLPMQTKRSSGLLVGGGAYGNCIIISG